MKIDRESCENYRDTIQNVTDLVRITLSSCILRDDFDEEEKCVRAAGQRSVCYYCVLRKKKKIIK